MLPLSDLTPFHPFLAPQLPLVEDPASEKLLAAHKRRRMQSFARSLTQIEELREEQTELLKRTLNVRQLPTNFKVRQSEEPDAALYNTLTPPTRRFAPHPALRSSQVCDPNILPFLSPKIQAVCNQFPILAEEVVKEYGLNSDEFNKMMEETKRNPMFRWRVNRYVKRMKGMSGMSGDDADDDE